MPQNAAVAMRWHLTKPNNDNVSDDNVVEDDNNDEQQT